MLCLDHSFSLLVLVLLLDVHKEGDLLHDVLILLADISRAQGGAGLQVGE